jgi:sulfur carrier protein
MTKIASNAVSRTTIEGVRLKVNGEGVAFDEALTVADLLRSRGLLGKRVAVERNGEIVPRSAHDSAQLHDGDRVEIVVAVGGG